MKCIRLMHFFEDCPVLQVYSGIFIEGEVMNDKSQTAADLLE